jgi:hypothetical protein
MPMALATETALLLLCELLRIRWCQQKWIYLPSRLTLGTFGNTSDG